MPAHDLPARPNLDQYKRQAKELLAACRSGDPTALRRAAGHRGPRSRLQLADAQFIIAREHGFESWPKFSRHIEQLALARTLASIANPVDAFIEAATVPRDAHTSGTLERAKLIRQQYPEVVKDFYAAATLGDEVTVRAALARNAASATAPGGPYRWDALTYLCFSRYLRLDRSRAPAFVATARALLDAGANANTGWYETIDHPHPRPVFEAVIYGAAGIAQHPDLTRLLLQRGADPNDEETPYHVPETTDSSVLEVLLESGRLSEASLSTMLVRKSDWHDLPGMRLLLEHGADPNRVTRWGYTALHQAVRRDNVLRMIAVLLDHGADPRLPDQHGRSSAVIAVRRGRGDVLRVLERRGLPATLTGHDRLIAACALDDHEAIVALRSSAPDLSAAILAEGGTLLSEFAGNGNTVGVRRLLECGVDPAALYEQGDAYFGIAPRSTALHVAAWRAHPEVVRTLIAAGTPVDAMDGDGRTALMLAVKACVDSYWSSRRSPQSVAALLDAGATAAGIDLPTGYEAIDVLLARAGAEK
jgi:ankyrin repeat protein